MTTTPTASTPSTSESVPPATTNNHHQKQQKEQQKVSAGISPKTNYSSTTTTNSLRNSAASSFQRSSPVLTWLDALEKDFDKAFVDLDLLIGEVDTDQSEITYEARQKMTSLSSCFAQLIHKSQSLFQKNVKLEAEVDELKDDLSSSISAQSELEMESQNLMLQVHSLQCQLYSKNAPHESDMIKKKIEQELYTFRTKFLPPAKLQAEVTLLRKENTKLRSLISSMQTEIYGARLAAKYLDKELAGRIQQIQLLGRDMRGAEHDRLWNQLEAEIHLHRHKTVIKACRGREGLRRLAFPSTTNGLKAQKGIGLRRLAFPSTTNGLKAQKGIGKTRTIILTKQSHEGLGISITGGKEHGVPILISEIHPDQPGERCGQLFVGDAILSVNGISLKSVKHSEAVAILSKEMVENNELTFECVYVSPEQDSDDDGDVLIETDDGSMVNIYDVFDGNETSRSSSASNHAAPIKFQKSPVNNAAATKFENNSDSRNGGGAKEHV
uniref:PDZ domain-containing protein n=1 Tax=Panagrolaimus sp. ES5 TaxID=591445 RepID=A0AC34G086_9BILA